MESEKNIEQSFNIAFSKDNLQAYIEVKKPGIEYSDEEISQIITEVKEKNVIINLNIEQVKEKIVFATGFEKITIAEGRKPIDGKDGYCEFLFEKQGDGTPLILEDGRVDFKTLGLVINVQPDDVLAKVYPPKDGVNGANIFGEEIPFKPGKPARPPIGKNVRYDEEKCQIISNIAGQVSISDNNINVNEVLEVKDVDFKTGNIDFVGNVNVQGAITDGFTVRAKGDVTVNGYVDSSFVYCDGNLTIKGGLQGRNKGKVQAGGNVIAKYIENCEVKAGGSVVVRDAIMHSKVYAKERVLAAEGKGLMVGGVIGAGKEIYANTIGSHLATVTELEVGVNPEMREKLHDINKEVTQHTSDLKKAKQAQRILRIKDEQLQGNLPQEQKGMLMRLNLTIKHLEETVENLQTEQKELMEKFLGSSGGKIKGTKTVYPGVRITIGTRNRNITDILNAPTFILASDGEITIT